MSTSFEVEDVAYEQLPESVKKLINALDGTNLSLLPTGQRQLIECAIRAVLNDRQLTGVVEEGSL